MADSDELTFIIRMRDEASAVLKQATGAVQEHGDAHSKAAKQVGEFSGKSQDGSKHVESFRQLIRAATGNADSFGGAVRNVASEMVKFGAPLEQFPLDVSRKNWGIP
jgi:methyl-accepting chemotaxis protein